MLLSSPFILLVNKVTQSVNAKSQGRQGLDLGSLCSHNLGNWNEEDSEWLLDIPQAKRNVGQPLVNQRVKGPCAPPSLQWAKLLSWFVKISQIFILRLLRNILYSQKPEEILASFCKQCSRTLCLQREQSELIAQKSNCRRGRPKTWL